MNLNHFEVSRQSELEKHVESSAANDEGASVYKDLAREDLGLKSGGSIDLSQVKDPEEIKNIEWGEDFSGSLALNRLTSAKGLKLPKRFQGRLILRSLESAEGLVLPDDFEGTLDLGELSSIDFLNLPGRFKGDLYLRGVSSLKGLHIPPGFDGTIFINPAVSREDLSTREIATRGHVEFVHSLGMKAPRKRETTLESPRVEVSEALAKISGVLYKNLSRAFSEVFKSGKK